MTQTSPHDKKIRFKLVKEQYPFDLKKYLTLRNLLIMFLLVLLYFAFPKSVQAIILIVIFFPIGQFSVRTSKYVRDMSIEMVTSFTVFLGYLYGWEWAFFYGVILGTYMWAQTSIKMKTLISIMLTGACAFLGQWSASWFPNNFVMAYLVVITIRNIAGFFMFIPFNTIFNNIMYTATDAFWNTLIMSIVLSMIYRIVILLPA